MYKIQELNALPMEDLVGIAEKLNMPNPGDIEKKQLIYKILDQQALTATEKTQPQESGKKHNNNHTHRYRNAHEKKTNSKHRKKNGHNQQKGRTRSFQGDNKKKGYKNVLQVFAGLVEGEGTLDLMTEGYGFLRSSDYNYLASVDDIHVSHGLVKKWELKQGDTVRGKLRPPKEDEKYFGLMEIISVNGQSLKELGKRKNFRHLVPLFPKEQFQLGYKPEAYALRMLDLFAPIGKGQRAVIVAPPKAGKTLLLKEIANSISISYQDTYIIVLMIEERPEEVTDMRRSVKAEVIASTFDEENENHIRVANITIEKAKRLVECGYDVVIILDSLTRLVRAYNAYIPSSGKTLSGGVDPNALHIPKRIFGSARNIEHGGSLTIIASVLVDTGSRMDQFIFEELKGRGNMEVYLSRTLANKGIYPAIDILSSSTRRSEIMQPPEKVKLINMLRRIIADMNTSEEATSFILDNMRGTSSNETFLASIHS